jgi:hypothetical protein
MSKEDIKPKKVKIRSNLDMVGHAMDDFGNYPIFSQRYCLLLWRKQEYKLS